MVLDTLEKIDPELMKKDDVVWDLYAILERRPSLTKEDLEKKANELFGYGKVEKDANQKAQQHNKITGKSQSTQKPVKKEHNKKIERHSTSMEEDFRKTLGVNIFS